MSTGLDLNPEFLHALKVLEEMKYNRKPLTGFKAFCLTRQEERHFRIDRVLELKGVGSTISGELLTK